MGEPVVINKGTKVTINANNEGINIQGAERETYIFITTPKNTENCVFWILTC